MSLKEGTIHRVNRAIVSGLRADRIGEQPGGIFEISNKVSPEQFRNQAKPYLEKYRRLLRRQISDGISPGVDQTPNIIEVVKEVELVKPEKYHPAKTNRVIEKQRERIRTRRASRCNGVHDAEQDPCGSPRCRTRGRVKTYNRERTRGSQKNILSPKTKSKKTNI